MEKMISYICGDIHMLKNDMGVVAKILKNQNTINKCVSVVAVLTSLYMLCDVYKDKQYDEKIEKLTKEVEELKKSKGE